MSRASPPSLKYIYISMLPARPHYRRATSYLLDISSLKCIYTSQPQPSFLWMQKYFSYLSVSCVYIQSKADVNEKRYRTIQLNLFFNILWFEFPSFKMSNIVLYNLHVRVYTACVMLRSLIIEMVSSVAFYKNFSLNAFQRVYTKLLKWAIFSCSFLRNKVVDKNAGSISVLPVGSSIIRLSI